MIRRQQRLHLGYRPLHLDGIRWSFLLLGLLFVGLAGCGDDNNSNGGNRAPEVTITAPADEQVFTSSAHQLVNGEWVATVSVTAEATDAEDGNLTGDQVVWEARKVGSSAWQQQLTGTSGTVTLINDDEDITQYHTVYQLRVRVTDSDGRTADDIVTIELAVPK